MKVYLISSSSSASDDIVSILDNANVSVVAKEVQDDEEALNAIEKQLGRGSADMMLFVTEDQVGANIELNKLDGVRAASCNNAQEVSVARANDVNVIIINPKTAQIDEVTGAIVKKGAGMGKMFQGRIEKKRRVEAPQQTQRTVNRPAPQAVAPQAQPPMQLPKIAFKFPTFPPKQPAQKVQSAPQKPSGPKKGLVDTIKDELGIID